MFEPHTLTLLCPVGTLLWWMACSVGLFLWGSCCLLSLLLILEKSNLTGGLGSYVNILIFSDIAQSSIPCVIVCPSTPLYNQECTQLWWIEQEFLNQHFTRFLCVHLIHVYWEKSCYIDVLDYKNPLVEKFTKPLLFLRFFVCKFWVLWR